MPPLPPRRGALLAALAAALLSGAPARAAGAPVSVAVAANFTEPAQAIAAAFRRATGQEASLSFGASGAFLAQITHGAPFEVFLSADVERAEAAERAGAAVAGTRFTYATGALVLWSRRPGLVDGAGAVLRRPGAFHTLAIADPAAAPYGAAAVETLTRLGLLPALKPRLVQGASIAQAYQFAATGAADLAFVALSQVVDTPGGSRWRVPERLHAPIDQAAVLLRPGADDPAARRFLAFLKGPEARAIIRRYGYGVR